MIREDQPITRAPEGAHKHTVPLGSIVVPDLWHLAEYLDRQAETNHRTQALECWHLCNDLLQALKNNE